MKRILATLLLVVLLLSGGLSASAAGGPEPAGAPASAQYQGQFKGASAVKPANLANVKKPDDPALRKMSAGLLPLVDQAFLPMGVTLSQYQDQLQEFGSAKLDKAAANDKNATGILSYVYVKVRKSSDLSQLTAYAKIDNQKDTLAAAWMSPEKLQELASKDWVVSISEVTAPIVNKTDTSEGVKLHKADLAQKLSTGSGVKIGVISDGANSYQQAVASGDLPGNVTILSDVVGGDEGTAMLEIVYDMAPGAKLYFHDCGTNIIAFNEAVDALIAAGCTIVVDDIGWITQPFFEDGEIATHFKEIAAKNKVLFVSSAGNAAGKHYQGVYKNSTRSDGWHDFSNGTSDAEDLYVRMYPGSVMKVVLQWKEPFGSSNLSNYDLVFFDANTGDLLPIYSGMTDNAGTQMPLEFVGVQYNGYSYIDVAVSVYRNNAPVPKELEVYVYTSGATMFIDNIVKADSIFGHSAVPGVISCGAIDAFEPTNPLTIESFSSQGPVTTLTGKRNKPDVCGADGVSVTGAGGFPSQFYGTSAAAPHIAAIAALIKARFPTYTPTQIASTITKYSTDLGAPGYDTVYGYGLTNAYAAVNSAAYTITVKANNTSYGSVSGGGSYTSGTQVAVKAIPKAGYRFARWVEGTTAVSANAEYKFTATKSRTLTAEFAKIGTPVVMAVSGGYNSIKLTWAAVTGAAKYEIYRATASAGPFTRLTEVSTPSYTGTGLVTGKTYYYKVRAKCIAGSTVTYGGYSTVVSAKPIPSTPAVKVASVTYNSAKLTWAAVPGATKYEIYRATTSTGTYTKLLDVSTPSYTGAGLTTGKTYYYKVRAKCIAGSTVTYGGYSAVVSVKPIPATPTTFKVASTTYNSVKLTWAAVTGATKYEIYRASTSTGTYTKLSDVSTASYTGTGLITGKAYYYKVRAYRLVSGIKYYSGYSAVVKATPLPAAPTGLKALKASSTSVKLYWGSVAGAMKYEVYRATSATGTYYKSIETTSLSFVSSNLTKGNTYYFKVRAYRIVGTTKYYGPFSSVVSYKHY